ncbi:Ion-translocating oxidoreductase complex subunit B [Buchnera aphidicola (Eriosoma lanigerum)]|uniref:RnfABCDGE type electron transport complex subunit B n=1 Tax=Buchnera aphidicola TaxID=9 RepID=UPI00346441CD
MLILKTVFFFGCLTFFLSLILIYISEKYVIYSNILIDSIDNLLPQSQCGQCQYVSCYSYAKAIILNGEKINKCIPGGMSIIKNISNFLNVDVVKDQHFEDNNIIIDYRIIAWINEDHCVGCNKCIHVCPVDSIIGSKNLTHTIISDFCTGCKLCIEVCPTDCIKLRKVEI